SLTKKGIQFSGQSLTFDYLSFCRNIDIKVIDDIISIGSPLEYNQFLLQEEIYIYLPEAKVRLESLCELTCDTL
ncbi:17223_t:CDS:2, partial [Rhizophagus irregularis]